MIVTVRLTGLDGLARRLEAALAPRLVPPALDAAAAALAAEAARHGVPATIEGEGEARRVGSADAAAVARETGTLQTAPDPWLAPALAILRRRT